MSQSDVILAVQLKLFEAEDVLTNTRRRFSKFSPEDMKVLVGDRSRQAIVDGHAAQVERWKRALTYAQEH